MLSKKCLISTLLFQWITSTSMVNLNLSTSGKLRQVLQKILALLKITLTLELKILSIMKINIKRIKHMKNGTKNLQWSLCQLMTIKHGLKVLSVYGRLLRLVNWLTSKVKVSHIMVPMLSLRVRKADSSWVLINHM